jgi:hypothetical protein
MKVIVKDNNDNCIGQLQLSIQAVNIYVNGNKVYNNKYISQWKLNYY